MKKHLISDMKGNFVELPKSTYKSKPRVIDDIWFNNMVRDRERVFYKEAKERGDTVEMDRILKRML